MAGNFRQDKFMQALYDKCPRPETCPFCHSTDYMATDAMAMLNTRERFDGITTGEALHCGIVICHECGHVSLFSLGALGLTQRSQDRIRKGGK